MRFTPVILATAVMLITYSSASIGETSRPSPISALSRAMYAEGEQLRAAGDLVAANGYYETALVSDPRNAAALIGMGEVARAQNLPGKAIGYFREALALSPDNRAALLGQGRALVERGAVDRARANLVRLQTLCGDQVCPEIAVLTGAINAAGERTALRRDEVLPQPVIEPAPASN